MTGMEILALVQYLTALGRKLIRENREATAEELAKAGLSRDAALGDLDDAIAEAEADADGGDDG